MPTQNSHGNGFGDQEIGQAIQSCSPDARWVEVQVLEHDGTSRAGEPYEVILPDGERRKGNLDDQGLLRLDDIPPGDCIVTFPEIDEDDWELPELPQEPPIEMVEFAPAIEPEAIATDWIELEIVNQAKEPLIGEPYRLVFDDGTVFEDVLEEGGFVRLEGVPKGECTVTFPNIDQDDWELPPLPDAPPIEGQS